MAVAAADLKWITYALKDLHIYQTTPVLFCYNLSVLHVTVNPIFHSRSTHIEIDYHFVREQVALKLLETRHVSSVDQVANVFTKPLLQIPFHGLLLKL